jgi:hypothetical protein
VTDTLGGQGEKQDCLEEADLHTAVPCPQVLASGGIHACLLSLYLQFFVQRPSL